MTTETKAQIAVLLRGDVLVLEPPVDTFHAQMESKVFCFDDPTALHRFAVEQPLAPAYAHYIRLCLFEPLRHYSWISQCPLSHLSQPASPTDDALLENIDPVSRAWRAALCEFPTTVKKITFDISLPEYDASSDAYRVGWDREWDSTAKKERSRPPLYAIPMMTPHRLVQTMATGISVRSRKSVDFDHIHNYDQKTRGRCHPHLTKFMRQLVTGLYVSDDLKEVENGWLLVEALHIGTP